MVAGKLERGARTPAAGPHARQYRLCTGVSRDAGEGNGTHGTACQAQARNYSAPERAVARATATEHRTLHEARTWNCGMHRPTTQWMTPVTTVSVPDDTHAGLYSRRTAPLVPRLVACGTACALSAGVVPLTRAAAAAAQLTSPDPASAFPASASPPRPAGTPASAISSAGAQLSTLCCRTRCVACAASGSAAWSLVSGGPNGASTALVEGSPLVELKWILIGGRCRTCLQPAGRAAQRSKFTLTTRRYSAATHTKHDKTVWESPLSCPVAAPEPLKLAVCARVRQLRVRWCAATREHTWAG